MFIVLAETKSVELLVVFSYGALAKRYEKPIFVSSPSYLILEKYPNRGSNSKSPG